MCSLKNKVKTEISALGSASKAIISISVKHSNETQRARTSKARLFVGEWRAAADF